MATKTTDKKEYLNLVVDGVSDYVIVRGKDTSPSEITAAKELQSYLKKISGALIPIKNDEAKAIEKEIVVGKTNREANGEFDREKLGEDGFIIKTSGGRIWLAGGEKRGTLYAVYTFLEKHLGCRFYTATVEKIPKSATVALLPIEKDEQIPVFKYRDIDRVGTRVGTFQVKLKANGVYAPSSEVFGASYTFLPGFCHTIAALVGDESGDKQPCLSDPATLEKVIENVGKILEEHPDVNVIEISQNDNRHYCTCERCNKVFEEEGSQSGVLLRFVNAVAEKFYEKYPSVLFETLAYSYTQTPPKVTRPAPNVAVRLCPIYCCYSHPIDLGAYLPERLSKLRDMLSKPVDLDGNHLSDGIMDAHNLIFLEDLKAWSEICGHLMIWQYSADFHHTMQYFPNFNVLLANLRLFAENHVVGVYDEGNYFSETGDFPELRAYITAKCLWNPYMTEEEYWGHTDDFLEGVYGPGWRYIKDYIVNTQKLLKDTCYKCLSFPMEGNLRWTDFSCESLFPVPETAEVSEITANMIRNFETVNWTEFGRVYKKPDYLSYADECFSKAKASAATDGQKAIIEKTSLQVEFYRSWYLSKKYEGADRGAVDKLEAYFKAHPDEFEKEERENYKDKIGALAEKQAAAAIKAFNRKLFELCKKYNVTKFRENDPPFDFDADPESCLSLEKPAGSWR